MNLYVNNLLSSGWGRFLIMHKNRHVASIREDGTCTIYYPSFMPYNLYFEESSPDDISTRINNLNNFYYWCASRMITLDRKYAKEILNSIGVGQPRTDRERAAIAISYHALCLTDVFWVKKSGEKLLFEDISLYRHSLSNAFVDVSLTGKQLTLANSELITAGDIACDISTDGVAPKAWIREANDFYLIKNGSERDVNAELLASRIADCFDFPHVRYDASVFDGKKVTKCRLITSEKYSIVPIEYVDIYCINRDKSRHNLVLDRDSRSFYMMNIFDYLIGNTDRHWGNWGMLVDNGNNKLLRLYPLMDFNKAFLSYDEIDGGICQTVEERISQKDAAIEAVKKIGLNMIADIQPEWFEDADISNMFFERLSLLKK